MNDSNLENLVRPSAQLWGEGLVDQSIATRWRPINWDDVDADELAYFIPGLLAPETLKRAAESGSGPARFLNEARQTQLVRTVAALARLAPTGGERERQNRALGFVTALGITSVPARDLWDESRNRDQSPGIRTTWAGGIEAAAIYELSVLACIDRMLVDATKPVESADASAIQAPDASGVLIASMHSGVNGAYIYKDLAYAHETFATAAWIGKLLAGRPALLPDFIAEILTETAHRLQGDAAPDPLDELLCRHAVAAVGERRLLRLSRRVLRSGLPEAVTPIGLHASAPPQCSWNPELQARISRAIECWPSTCAFSGTCQNA